MARKTKAERAASLDVKSLARSHTVSAIKVLAGIMNQAKAPAAARAAAANGLLDRGWGKPTQIHAGDEDNGPIEIKVTIVNCD